MPDQSDVAGAVAQAAAGMLYPDGASRPSAVGATCRVFRGAVVAPALEADATAGIVQAAVTPVDGTWRDTSRFEDAWQVLRAPAPGLTVDLRAEMDVIVVVSNCPQINNPCNGFNPTPVRMLVSA